VEHIVVMDQVVVLSLLIVFVVDNSSLVKVESVVQFWMGHMLSVECIVVVVWVILVLVLEGSGLIVLINHRVVVIGISLVVHWHVMTIYVLVVHTGVVSVHWVVSLEVHWQLMRDVNMVLDWLDPLLSDDSVWSLMVVWVQLSSSLEVALWVILVVDGVLLVLIWLTIVLGVESVVEDLVLWVMGLVVVDWQVMMGIDDLSVVNNWLLNLVVGVMVHWVVAHNIVVVWVLDLVMSMSCVVSGLSVMDWSVVSSLSVVSCCVMHWSVMSNSLVVGSGGMVSWGRVCGLLSVRPVAMGEVSVLINGILSLEVALWVFLVVDSVLMVLMWLYIRLRVVTVIQLVVSHVMDGVLHFSVSLVAWVGHNWVVMSSSVAMRHMSVVIRVLTVIIINNLVVSSVVVSGSVMVRAGSSVVMGLPLVSEFSIMMSFSVSNVMLFSVSLSWVGIKMRSNNLGVLVHLSVLEVLKLGSIFVGWLVDTEVWLWSVSGGWLGGLIVGVIVLTSVAVVVGLVLWDAVLLAEYTLEVEVELVLLNVVSSGELVLHASEGELVLLNVVSSGELALEIKVKLVGLNVIHASKLARDSLKAQFVGLNRISLSKFALDVKVNIELVGLNVVSSATELGEEFAVNLVFLLVVVSVVVVEVGSVVLSWDLMNWSVDLLLEDIVTVVMKVMSCGMGVVQLGVLPLVMNLVHKE
jgi:hypothetical protein